VGWRYQLLGEAARLLPRAAGPRADAAAVLTTGHLGDILQAAPTLRRLREARPGWKIVWLAGPWAMPLVGRYARFADELVPFAEDTLSQHRGNAAHRQTAGEQWRIAMRLRALKPRLFLSAGNESPAARFLANASGAETWAAFGDRRPPRLRRATATYFLPYEKERFEADAVMGLLEALGIPPAPAELFFPLSEEERRGADAFLRAEGIDSSRPLVLVSPGSGWPGKNWPGTRFRAVAEKLLARGVQVAWTGSAGEAALAGEGEMPGKNWFGRFTVPELAAVMARASLWLGNDSGPMHVAAAVGCPTVSLWGPTEPGKWAPRGEAHRHLRQMPRCPGCEYWNPAKTCFRDTHACLEAIGVEDVWRAVSAALALP